MLLLGGVLATWWLMDLTNFDNSTSAVRSLALAYTSLFYLTVALAIGPINLWLSRVNPLSSHLRRDFGIWAGVLGLCHVGFGLQVHFEGDWARYFLARAADDSLQLKADWFRLTNYAGVAAVLIVAVLLFHSRDSSLRKLGPFKWKSRQRLTYVLVLLLVMHGTIYQLLEQRNIYGILLFSACLITIAITQLSGWKLYRNRAPPT